MYWSLDSLDLTKSLDYLICLYQLPESLYSTWSSNDLTIQWVTGSSYNEIMVKDPSYRKTV